MEAAARRQAQRGITFGHTLWHGWSQSDIDAAMLDPPLPHASMRLSSITSVADESALGSMQGGGADGTAGMTFGLGMAAVAGGRDGTVGGHTIGAGPVDSRASLAPTGLSMRSGRTSFRAVRQSEVDHDPTEAAAEDEEPQLYADGDAEPTRTKQTQQHLSQQQQQHFPHYVIGTSASREASACV